MMVCAFGLVIMFIDFFIQFVVRAPVYGWYLHVVAVAGIMYHLCGQMPGKRHVDT